LACSRTKTLVFGSARTASSFGCCALSRSSPSVPVAQLHGVRPVQLWLLFEALGRARNHYQHGARASCGTKARRWPMKAQRCMARSSEESHR
jgi:hypothetical protein